MINSDLYTEADFVADAFFNKKNSLIVEEPQKAMFYYFKASGKYYTEGKGLIPSFNIVWTREMLLTMNNGKMPGLSTEGLSLRIVVIPTSESVFGWPQILEPVE